MERAPAWLVPGVVGRVAAAGCAALSRACAWLVPMLLAESPMPPWWLKGAAALRCAREGLG